MTPERKTAQPEGEAAAEGGRHGGVGVAGVAAPVQRIALAAGPGTARPYDVLAGHLAGDVGYGLVVPQGVEVMLVEPAAAVGIHTRQRSGLAEIHLDRSHSHAHQARDLFLIPGDGRRIGEIEHGILIGQVAFAVPDGQPLGHDLREERILRNEVGELPKRDMKAILLQIGDHLRGVLETGGGELVIAAPVGLEPAGVEVNHVGRDAVLAQLGGHPPHLVFREIGDAAHPQPERPQRRHGRFSSEVGVFVEDVLRLAQEDEQVQLVVAQHQRVGKTIGGAEVECGGRGSMHEHAVSTAAHEERDGFVHAPGFHAVGIVGPQHNFLAALVEPRERLAAAEQLLAG